MRLPKKIIFTASEFVDNEAIPTGQLPITEFCNFRDFDNFPDTGIDPNEKFVAVQNPAAPKEYNVFLCRDNSEEDITFYPDAKDRAHEGRRDYFFLLALHCKRELEKLD